MNFSKTNFVEEVARELKISVGEYLKYTRSKYVIFYKGKVDTLDDGNPFIYNDETEVINEIKQSNGLDENGNPNNDFNVMTEWDFICTYCKDWLITYLANNICNNDDNEYDGTCWVHWFDNGFYGAINLDNGKYTDILGAYVGQDGFLSFNVCNGNDNATFVGLGDFDNDVIYKITMSILCGLEYNQLVVE